MAHTKNILDRVNDKLTLSLGSDVVYDMTAGTVKRGAEAAEAVDVNEEIYLDNASGELAGAMGWAAPDAGRIATLDQYRREYQRPNGLYSARVRTYRRRDPGFVCPYTLPSYNATLRVPGTYATLDLAYAAAVDGDVILIDPGTYTIEVPVTKSCHWIGNTGDPVGSPVTIQSGNANFGFFVYDAYGAGLQNDVYFENLNIAPEVSGGNLALGLYMYCNGYYYSFNRCRIDASATGNYGMRAGTDPDSESILTRFHNCRFSKGAADFNEIGVRTQDTIEVTRTIFDGGPTFVLSAYVLPFHGDDDYVNGADSMYGPDGENACAWFDDMLEL